MPARDRRWARVAIAVAFVLLAWVFGHGTPSSSSSVAATSLPPEARQTLALIERGGPFPYDQDGVVFENREGLLPDHDPGYYHEYTVPTPGSPDRGARRIISGSAGELYDTDDHYRSFERIDK